MRRRGPGEHVSEHLGYYFLRARGREVVQRRAGRERNANRLWKIARIPAQIIKRFPFVRGVFVSGDLSKNTAGPESDIDFFIVTAPGRLWIARTLLVLFKKVFLFNNKKYFCLNSFISEDHLRLEEQNLFLATEIAHLKPLYNSKLLQRYLEENRWIRNYFPNFDRTRLAGPEVDDRPSLLQRLLEIPFRLLPSDRIDRYVMRKMNEIWKARYPEFSEQTRRRIFLSTRNESRAYAGNYQEKILDSYRRKLEEFHVKG
jgi:hypothetical protein